MFTAAVMTVQLVISQAVVTVTDAENPHKKIANATVVICRNDTQVPGGGLSDANGVVLINDTSRYTGQERLVACAPGYQPGVGVWPRGLDLNAPIEIKLTPLLGATLAYPLPTVPPPPGYRYELAYVVRRFYPDRGVFGHQAFYRTVAIDGPPISGSTSQVGWR